MAEPLALVFDLDGTLIDSAPDIHATANKVFATKGLEPFPFTVVRSFIGNGVGVLVSRLLASRGLDPDGALHAELVGDFVNFYEEAFDLTNVYPDCRQALETLHSAGHRLGICTNKPEAPARAALRFFGLAGLFDVVVGGDSLAERKPHPAPLRAALRDLSCTHAVFVGDSEVDAETAKAARVPFALFTGGYRKATAESLGARLVFDHHAALPRLIGHHAAKLVQSDL